MIIALLLSVYYFKHMIVLVVIAKLSDCLVSTTRLFVFIIKHKVVQI